MEQSTSAFDVKDPTDMTIAQGTPAKIVPAKTETPIETGTTNQPDITQTPVPQPSKPSMFSNISQKSPVEEKGPLVSDLGQSENGSIFGSIASDASFYDPQSKMVLAMADQTPDPKAFVDSYDEARALNKAFPDDNVFDIMKNKELYLKMYFGENYTGKTAPKAIWDSVLAGEKMIELGHAGFADMMGESGNEPDYKTKELYKQIAELQLDRTPRGVVVQSIKTIGNMLPYTGYFVAISGLSSLAGNYVGTLAEGAGYARAVPFILKAARGLSFAESARVMAGGDYADMIANGVDRNAARTSALTTGIINAGIEQYLGLGLEGGVRRALTPDIRKVATDKIAARMIASGATKSLARKITEAGVNNAVGEVSEEYGQSWVSGVGAMVAEALTEDDTGIMNKTDIEQVAHNAAQSAWTAAWTSVFLGLPIAGAQYFNSKEDAKAVGDAAMFSTKEQFVKNSKNMPQFDGVPKDKIDDVAGTIWESKQKTLAIEKSKRRENANQKQIENQNEPVRNSNGSLDITESVQSDAEGNQIVSFQAMNADSQTESYGEIVAVIDEKNLTIKSADFKPTYEGISDEFLQEVSARFPDKKVLIGDDASDIIVGSYDRIEGGDATGKQIAAPVSSRDEAMTINHLRQELSGKGAVSPLGVETAIEMTKFALGESFSRKASMLKVETDESLDETGKAGSFSLRQIANQAEYVIKLSKTANASTVVHELLHFARIASNKKEQIKAIEDVYGIENGSWKTEHEERFVNDVMTLMRDGKVKDQRAKPFLTHVADFLRRLWKGPLSKVKMDEKVEAALNDWLSAPGEKETQAPMQKTREEARVAQGAEPELGISLDKSNEQKGNLIPHSEPAGMNTERVELESLSIMKNFKEGSDAKTGITKEGRIEKYNPVGANPIQVFEEKDGTRWVTSGRHRTESAIRSGEKTIAAYVFREVDGHTIEQAFMRDVLDNIQNGDGSVRDFVAIAREGVITYGEAESRGLMGKVKARQGFLIGEYAGNELYSAFMGGIVSAEKAAVIADIGRKDDELQKFGLSQQKGINAEGLADLMKWYQKDRAAEKEAAGQATFEDVLFGRGEGGAQGDMFGSSFDDRIKERKHLIESAQDLVSDLQKDISVRNTALSQSAVDVQARLKGEANTKIEDEALLRSKISMLEDQKRRIKDGEWQTDPHLASMVYEKAGLPLTEFMKDALATAYQMSEIIGQEESAQQVLFMSSDDLNASRDSKKEYEGRNASKYDTFESWVKKEFPYTENLTTEDMAWLKEVYDYAQSGAEKRYGKPGMFAAVFSDNKKIENFLSDTFNAIVQGRNADRNSPESIRGKRLSDAISGSAVLSRAIDRMRMGKSLVDSDFVAIRRFIKDNEALVKFIMARVEGDKNLALEAALDMKRVPVLSKKTVLVKPGLSLADQQDLISKIQDNYLKDRVRTRKFTLADLGEYRKKIEAPLDQKMREKDAAVRDYKEYIRERDALRRLMAEINRQKKFIMHPVSSSVAYEEAKMIEFIQQYLRNPNKDPASMAKNIRALASIVFQSNPVMVEDLISLLDGISQKPFAEWGFDEVEALSDYIDSLITRGKSSKASDRLAWNLAMSAERRRVIGTLQDAPDVAKGGTIEEDQQKKAHKFTDIFEAPVLRIDLVASYFLDNRTRGINTRILFDEMITHQREKLSQIQTRTSDVTSFISKYGIEKHIHREMAVDGLYGADGKAIHFTAGTLLGAYLMVGKKDAFNQHQREAYVFGNLFSQEEKESMGDARLFELLDDRAGKIIEAAEAMLTKEELDLGDKMLHYMNRFDDWERMATEILAFSGREMSREKFYFPIKMVGPVSHEDDSITAAFAKEGFDKAISSGFVYDRSKGINPINRRPVDINSMRIFYDSIKHQEHLVAFGQYVKKLKSIYGDATSEGKIIREKIQASYGEGILKNIDRQIDTLCQPGDFSQKDISEKPFSLLRGSMVVANLSYRLSSVLMQLGTSPLPFLSEVNALDLSRVAMQAIATGKPWEWYKTIEGKSAILKDRQLETIVELARMKDTGFEGIIKRFGNKGMQGLVFADRFSVAIGWQALVEKQVAKGMSKPEAHDYADKFVIRTQPSSEELYKAPMYRDMTLFKRVFLQFTQPMNVIYQNLFYDTQVMANEGHMNNVLALCVAYMVSGIAVGATSVMRGRGPEDEDKWLAYWIAQSTGQISGSVPLVGDALSQFILSTAIDEPFRPFGDDNLPVATDLFNSLGQIRKLTDDGSDEAKQKALAQAALFMYRGLGSAFGAPVLASENAAKFVVGLTDQ